MQSERIQQRIDRLLAEADEAVAESDWARVRDRAENVLRFDPTNGDALAYLAAADRGPSAAMADGTPGASSPLPTPPPEGEGVRSATSGPTSFANGRYQVQRFLGEGGKKRVYLAHDRQLDRDVAFALLKSESLDLEGLVRIRREAQAMGRLGDHPHIVTVFDIGDENDQPYIVSQYMGGGSLQSLIEQAPERRLPLNQTLAVADQACQALEHAHTNGVIHRDLKPGNVFLSGSPSPQPSPAGGVGVSSVPLLPQRERLGEGTSFPVAALGDFGLAMALDRSRLTQAGMMVGTVAYMAPEQALGSEVTPRSDLYSLGCMLYELVTGRPPFIGDESVAIITQHLNTPPVSPSWHVPDLPPGLEALILRLLEKDPAKRPSSAAEVRELLASVASPSSQPSPARGVGVSSPPPAGEGEGLRAAGVANDPLYRQTFVGREAEQQQLQRAFDAALSGQGGLTMVIGEPGIGKTALCEQLATYVAVRGGKTLVGHCYEEGSLSLPYLAFVEALRTYVLGRDPEGLKSDLGSNGPEVARIISEVRERANIEPRTSAGDAEEERWRLLQAVTAFLRNAASVQPLLVVLEDLHWADRGTLDLLQHVARDLQGARLLIVGTYRDVEVDRAHPLSATLAELRRSGPLPRVLLRGLTIDEVHRMMNVIRGQEVPWSRAEAIHRQTEGNPLFVQEVLRYLVEEGLVVREGGRYVPADGGGEADFGIPEGLRDVVGRRLNHLSERANQVLSAASVIGREFRLDVLQRVSTMSEDEVIEALEEAEERAVIEERPAIGGIPGFRFTHALFRQTLYEEIFSARRIRWHQQVARALEAVHARRLDEHAPELAEHFAYSSDPGDLSKAVEYGELAAQRALSVFAYGEAARHLEQALKAQDVLDPDDKAKRCDLLLALGEVMLPMEEPRRVADIVAGEAFALAEAIEDSHRAARAAVQACDAFLRQGYSAAGGSSYASAEFGQWAARADQHAPSNSIERIYSELYLGLHRIQASGPAVGHVHLRRAAELALELDDSAAFFAAASWVVARLGALRDNELHSRVAAEALRRPREGARTRDLSIALSMSASAAFNRGDRPAAEEAWRELGRLAERTRDVNVDIGVSGAAAAVAFADGRLEETRSLHDSIRARAEAAGVGAQGAGVGGVYPLLDARARRCLGQSVEGLLGSVSDPGRVAQGQRAVILSWLGHGAEIRTIRERFGDVGADADESAIGNLANLLEASLGVGDVETARALLRRLAPLTSRIQLVRGTSIGRLVGEAAALLGQPDAARGYYALALEVCERVRFRPEIALLHLDLAELAFGDQRPAISRQPAATTDEPELLIADHLKADALAHLDFASEEFRAMKMQPFLERARRVREAISR